LRRDYGTVTRTFVSNVARRSRLAKERQKKDRPLQQGMRSTVRTVPIIRIVAIASKSAA